MKVSICIPQYNRINYLLKSLKKIEEQTYSDIEVIVSDDNSSDDTEDVIKDLIPKYRYSLVYSKNVPNKGFDYNYRKCIELATGDYALVIGNDDTLNNDNAIEWLVNFLNQNNYPDIGYCNCIDERAGNILLNRAHDNKLIGSGDDVAFKHYSCFSFVGGLIYKKSTFNRFNTDKHDGSVYTQMYLGCLMVINGARLFSIKEPLVIKDILIDNKFRNSYRDRIAKKWKDFKIVTGGLPSVINVLLSSFKDSNKLSQKLSYKIFRRIYGVTFPFWIQDYKSNNALPEAVGLFIGMNPLRNNNFKLLSFINKSKIITIYYFMGIVSFLLPNFVFRLIQNWLYKIFKK